MSPLSCLCWSIAVWFPLAAAAPLTAQQPKLRSILGVEDKTTFHSLVFSPDNKTLACVWSGHKIRIYDAVHGKILADFDAHKDAVARVALAYRPDGKVLASVPETTVGGVIRLWDTATFQKIRELNSGFSHCLAFSPDGKTLASAGQYREVQLWNPETGKRLASMEGSKNPASLLAFSPDGKTLASVGFGTQASVGSRRVTLWDLTAKKKFLQTIPFQLSPMCLAFSPDGKTLACGGLEKKLNKIELWDLAKGKSATLFKSAEGEVDTGFTSLAYTPDGKTLVTTAFKQITLLSTTTGRPEFRWEYPASDGSNHSISTIALSPDGLTLAAANGPIRVWDLPAAKRQ